MKSIDDLDVLNVRGSVSSIAEMFHVISKVFIMLLLDGLQSFCCRWMLIRALKVANEKGTQLLLVVDSSFGQIDELGSSHVGQCYGQIVGLYSIVISHGLNDCVVNLDEFFRVVEAVILVDRPRLELINPKDLP
jgi:hypothetical protein